MNLSHSRRAELYAQAQIHTRAGRVAEAESIYRAIVDADPGCHAAYQELALLAFGAGRLLLAAELLKSAISLDCNIALYFRNYGEICRRLGYFDEAVGAARRACALASNDIDAHFNLALACTDARRSDAADAYRKVLVLLESHSASDSEAPRRWNMHGVALRRLERHQEARASFEKALELRPDFPMALNALGCLLIDFGEVDSALGCFTKAIALAPGFAEARLNLGMAQLRVGDWQAGWENYEARWVGSAESNNGTFTRPVCPLPQWDGQGESDQQGLLVFAEQGFGDVFQFSRFLDAAVQRFAKVGFVCPVASTHLLMERSFGEQVAILKCMPLDYATWHWQCPLLSLPRALHTRPNTIPNRIPYLKVASAAQAHWHSRLLQRTGKRLTVGVAWAGRPTHSYDRDRSLRFEQLLPLLGDQRISWISLQKLGPEDVRPVVPDSVDWIDWSEELIDFADTAALVSNLDLVISIDSAMVHLAGGLGRPVWMLNRFNSEWRWMGRRADSPWYPGLRIFNQSHYGDWVSVLTDVRAALGMLHKGL
jgi:Tfp pilus assembly protein PilF